MTLRGEELLAWAHQSPFASKEEGKKKKDLGARSILKESFFSFPCAPLGLGNSRQVLGVNPPGYLDVNQEGDDGFTGVQADLHSRVWSLQALGR